MVSRSGKAQIIYQAADRPFVERYCRELERRHVQIEHVAFNQLSSLRETTRLPSARVIVLSTKSKEHRKYLRSIRAGRDKLGARAALLLIDPVELTQELNEFLVVNANDLPFDLAFEEVMRFVMGPLPDWVRLYCRPSQMAALTGATWWGDDIIFADEYYGHVIRIKGNQNSVLLNGLDEPYHLHLDRRCLLVTNLGYNEIICARIQGSSLSKVHSIPNVLGHLKRPHGVFQGNDHCLIADTDNHRVLWKRGAFDDGSQSWNELRIKVNFPCGIYGYKDGAWIADTFNHRVLNVRLKKPGIVCQLGGIGSSPGRMAFPIAVCAWNEFLFVSDEQNKRLQVFKRHDQKGINLLLVDSSFGSSFIGSPLGTSVNRSCCLLIADRDRGCCWAIDLRASGLI